MRTFSAHLCECGQNQEQIVLTNKPLIRHGLRRATFPPTFGMGEGFGLLNIQRYRFTIPLLCVLAQTICSAFANVKFSEP
jgi:hypothetical protein